MNKEEQMICRHLLDLANMCDRQYCPAASDFLTLNEQSLFRTFSKDQLPPVEVSMEGGFDLAERKIIVFKPIGVGDIYPTPICLLSIKPLMKKFSEPLTHRDYLGALLNLGILRSKLGDIIPSEDQAIVVCREGIENFICENLTRIKHTTVSCSVIQPHEFTYTPAVKKISGSIASVRLDCVIGLVFSGSRSKLTSYITGEKVMVNGKLITSNAYVLKDGDIISVRGLGKFRYLGTSAQTRKGRLYAEAELFQ